MPEKIMSFIVIKIRKIDAALPATVPKSKHRFCYFQLAWRKNAKGIVLSVD